MTDETTNRINDRSHVPVAAREPIDGGNLNANMPLPPLLSPSEMRLQAQIDDLRKRLEAIEQSREPDGK